MQTPTTPGNLNLKETTQMYRGIFNQETLGRIASNAFRTVPEEQHADLSEVYRATAEQVRFYAETNPTAPYLVDLVIDGLDWVEEIYNARMMS